MSKPKAHLSMSTAEINFVEPTRVEGTKFWMIGTTKPGATILWLDTLGKCSDLSVPPGTRVFLRRKGTKEAFDGNPTVKEVVATIIDEQLTHENDLIFLNVTLEKSLPELFMHHRG